MSVPPVAGLLDFGGAVVLVTGASGGIGSGIAQRFAAAGADVVLGYRSDVDGVQATVNVVEAAGRRVLAVQADVTKAVDVTDLFSQTAATFGRLDVLVNNAGIYPQAAIDELSADEWDATLSANLRSAHLCTQAAARLMRAQPDGLAAIVNIASIEADHPAPTHSHYGASKAGLLAYTRAAALELGADGIRVNAVSPGLIYREGIEDAWPEGVASWRAAAPLTRLGTPQDVADACLFLASRAARWVSGVNLQVDGGASARPLF